MKRPALVVVIVAALVIIAVVAYLAKPRSEEVENTQPSQPGVATQTASAAAAGPSSLASCVGPMDTQMPLANLAARHQWASTLLKSNHVEGATNELRSIATLDPGYPGINLDLSDALLKSRHAADAQDAVKLQLEISECLSKLPQSDLLAYCKSQAVADRQGGCVSQIEQINQKAHYQAGVIDSELARTAEAHTPATVAAVEPPRAVARPVVSAPVSAPAAAPIVAPSTAPATAPATPAADVAKVSVPERSSVGTVPAASAAAQLPPIKIRTTEAAEHVGQLATVCGPISGKHTAEQSNGKPTFVNFDRPYPNPGFTALIWGTDTSAVGEFPESGNACVTGTITVYRGSPEIVVHDAKSWYQAEQP